MADRTRGRAAPEAAAQHAPGAVYETIESPAALGYDPPLRLKIRANPSKRQWELWNQANQLDNTILPDQAPQDDAEREAAAQTRREERDARIQAALVELLGRTSEVCPALDFSTPEAAKATWDDPELPDEIWLWILQAPWEIVGARREAILKNFRSPSSTES